MHIPLNIARLCLDCDTVHNENQCPICTSKQFLFLQYILGKLEDDK